MRFHRKDSVLLIAAVAMLGLAGGVLSVPSLAEACPLETEIVRKAEPYGLLLPDCRAYEQVSPVNKNTTDAAGRPGLVHSSPLGDSVSYYSIAPFPVAITASDFPIYLSTRTDENWSTQGLDAPVEPGVLSEVIGLTEDNGEVLDDVTEELEERFLLAPGAEVDHPNVYVRDNATGGYRLLTTRPGELTYADSTPDGSYIIFTSLRHELVPGVVDEEGEPFLYEWDRETGQIRFVGYVGDNAPEDGTVAGSNEGEYATTNDQNAISEDGSRIFFSEKGENQKVYMREPSAGRTVEVSTGPAQWRSATPDGSKAFYTEGGNLYKFDVEGATRTAVTSGAAGVLGLVGISRNGSYAYFVANEVLAANQNSNKDEAQAGTPNLYEWHEGAATPITFIARLSLATDQSDWVGFAEPTLGGPAKGYKGSRVSANGTRVLISSTSLLINYVDSITKTPYKNDGNDELYLYNASSGNLSCVSCNLHQRTETAKYQTYLSESDAGSVPESRINALTRNLSAEGTRVFFQTEEELLPQANAQMNVYEWEQEGTGSCGVEEGEGESGGCLYLLSNGQSTSGAYFGDASESGGDVFFFTRQSLVGQDRDDNVDVYDAREDGGIAAQNPEPVTPQCADEDSCRGSGSVPGQVFGVPASATFSGVGNLAPPVESGGSGGPPAKPKAKPKAVTRAQKLADALKACQKESKKQRVRCGARVKRKYGTKAKKSDREGEER